MKEKIRLKYLALIFLGFMLFSGCNSFKKAKKSFDKEEYNIAIDRFRKAIKKEPAKANFYIAESFRKSNRLKEAAPFYAAAVQNGIENDAAHFYYAKSLKANEKYGQAEEVLENYLRKGKDSLYLKRTEIELSNLGDMKDIAPSKNYYEVKNLSAINTKYAEYNPVYRDGVLYFTSNRNGGKTYHGNGTPFTDIYRVRSKGARVNLSTLQKLGPNINDPAINDGTLALSPNGSMMIFAKANTGKARGRENVDLYFVRNRRARWSEPIYLNLNDRNAWDSSPALSNDGKRLYFSSDRDGGYGGSDLYVAQFNRRGRWVDVRNLGPVINTPGNEMFPYVSKDGKLYFASDGHPGYGNLDIFEATRSGGQTTIKNMGRPVNSSADDFAFHQFDLTRGFFSSNREGGLGDDDIYTFVNNDPDLKIVNYYLVGTTLTGDEEGNDMILPNSKVILVGQNQEILDEAFTGANGQFEFRVYPEEDYELIAEKIDYFTTRSDFSTVGKSVDKSKLKEFVTNVTFETKIYLNKIQLEKPIVLKNVYYDFDKWDIRPDAAKELDNLVTIMEDNPEISIELSSHTDARAEDDYNMELSQKRAKSAVDYIISNGISSNRIQAKGYGETKLIIENADTEQEHQINRRTEFKVTEYDRDNIEKEIVEDLEIEQTIEGDETDRFFETEYENN
ncbi:MAG TPA: OmpA family protein [Cyclobacteriaceae bacterium]